MVYLTRFALPVISAIILAACAAKPPAPVVADTPTDAARYEPAPMPFVHVRRGGTLGALEIPIPPKMPYGTGAVPVSSSPFRGSIVTGIQRSF